MKKKALVLDIDGTLTNSKKEITNLTRKKIQNIQKMGHIVILASGRPTKGMEKPAEELELARFGGYMLSFNGGRIVHCSTGNVVYQKTLPPEIVPRLHDYALAHDMGIVTYKDDTVLCGTRMDEYLQMESRINHMDVVVTHDFKKETHFPLNKCLLTAPPAAAAAHEKELQKRFGDALSIYRSEPFFIEIMPKNIDKAASLDVLLNQIGLTKKDAICCGDGFNDLSMIQYAGIGVAMANAQEVVKKAADFITLSNDEDGIAYVIDRFILKETSHYEVAGN
ncbi:MAG: Cof-type HAD-IIB family hydrolase [Clostridiales bacterium]|nr:Cof-type HAD-IIB family hydrolase [Clostridiales bacterium]